MSQSRQSHYEVLGVRSDAKPSDIVRARDRLAAEFRNPATPPNPRREDLVAEAFAVLSDAARREAYDASLAEAVPASRRRRPVLVAGAVVAVAAAAAYFVLTPGSPPVAAGRATQEIQADVSRSVGRVQAIELSGKATATGIAFTVAKGVMATTCEGLAPGAQVTVSIPPRSIPARVARTDETLGLCQLVVDGAGSWPLAIKGVSPKAGEKVYAAGVDAAGEVVLAEGVVKRVVREGNTEYIEASVPVAPAIGGRPLLDAWGRVLAFATAAQPGGVARHVLMPDEWSREPPKEAPPPPAPAPVPAPAESAPPAAAPLPGPSGILSAPPDKVEEMARKARAPKVPGDL